MNNYSPILIIVVVILALWIAWSAYMIVSNPRPPYQILAQLDNRVEIREYPSQLLAEATASNQNSGFRTLADYIFGGNQQQEQIGMTAPVYTKPGGNGMYMAFIMPQRYDRGNLPDPNNPTIKITEVPARTLATITFSGYMTNTAYERFYPVLQQTLAVNNIKTQGKPFVMQYNDPWTIPVMRRNEIAIQVKNS